MEYIVFTSTELICETEISLDFFWQIWSNIVGLNTDLWNEFTKFKKQKLTDHSFLLRTPAHDNKGY